jgi:hypothetical protein
MAASPSTPPASPSEKLGKAYELVDKKLSNSTRIWEPLSPGSVAGAIKLCLSRHLIGPRYERPGDMRDDYQKIITLTQTAVQSLTKVLRILERLPPDPRLQQLPIVVQEALAALVGPDAMMRQLFGPIISLTEKDIVPGRAESIRALDIPVLESAVTIAQELADACKLADRGGPRRKTPAFDALAYDLIRQYRDATGGGGQDLTLGRGDYAI